MRLVHSLVLVLGLVFLLGGKNFNTPKNRQPVHPFITGDGFRNFADFAYDETVSRSKFPYDQVKNGDIIFIKTDYLNEFFSNIHPKIDARYIVISHNSDYSAPRKCRHILDDDKIIAWFAQNPDCLHDKLIPIPLGLENRYNPNGNLSTMNDRISKKDIFERLMLLYVNFSLKTHGARTEVYKYFKKKQFCTIVGRVPYRKYLENLLESRFVLSSRGRGLDCHRIWESIYLGAIPVIKTSPMDILLADLPVVIIQQWDEVTPEFLEEQYKLLQGRTFAMEKIWINYWLDLITSYKNNA